MAVTESEAPNTKTRYGSLQRRSERRRRNATRVFDNPIDSITSTIVPHGILSSSLQVVTVKSTKHLQYQRLIFTYQNVHSWRICYAKKQMTWTSTGSCSGESRLPSSWCLSLGSEKRPNASV